MTENVSAFPNGSTEPGNATSSTYLYYGDAVVVPLSILMVIIIVLAIGGNIMVILTILRHRGMRTRTNMFIVNLAVADILVAALDMPVSLVTLINGEWIFGDAMCQLNAFTMALFLICSIHTLMYISIHKYISITRPFSRPIWDRTDPLHQSRDTVNKLWQEVAKKCGVKRECARAKWKHLRDTFRSQLKKCQNKKPGDQWMWYKSLSFLADQMRSRDAGSCCSPNDPDNDEQPPVLSKNEEGSSTDESNPIGMSLLTREPPLGQPYKRKAEYLLENDFPELHTSNHEYQVQTVTDSDANYYFMLSLLPQMSSLPPTKQMVLRLKIQELVVQEVLANQSENEINGNILVPTD